MRLRTLFAALLLTACSETVDRGSLVVCNVGDFGAGEDEAVDVSGTVTAVDDSATDCAVDVTLEDGEGESWSVGITVEDADAVDITPGIDLEVGDEVDVAWRYRLVWGDVTGLAISDADGLVLAADEGGWGGALSDEDTLGLQVVRGDDPVLEEKTSCEPIEGYEVVFEGDDTLALTPVDSSTLTVDGSSLTALAIRATEYGESSSCHTTDTTGFLTWVVSR